MADSPDLKHMVMTFRVSELQVLLAFAGKNKSGLKQDMMKRAIDLVNKRVASSVQEKIKELYRRRYPGRLAKDHLTPAQPPPPAANNFSPKKAWSKEYGQATNNSQVGRSHSNMDSSISPPPSHTLPHIPVNPDVRLRKLSFYDTLAELLKPSSLVGRGPSRFQEAFFVFHLTPQQAQDIVNSRDRQHNKCDYTVQVQMRFCLLETSTDQDDSFPPSICVRVNGKMAPLPNPIPTNKPGVEPRRPSRPVNITYICRISPTVSNHINVTWAYEYGRVFCVSVYLVKVLTSDILMKRLKDKGVKHPDHTRALIKEKLAHDPDSEIATTSLRVSLRCPLGKMRMSIPCRSRTCNHLQCFDLAMYLQMNERKPTWMCPVCNKPADYSKLFIDGLFTQISNKNPDYSEIEFFEDGNWKPRRDDDEKKDRDTPLNIPAIGIDDSPHKEDSASSSAPPPPSAAAAESSVIDLTETDDEVSDAETEIHDVSMSSSASTPRTSQTNTESDSEKLVWHPAAPAGPSSIGPPTYDRALKLPKAAALRDLAEQYRPHDMPGSLPVQDMAEIFHEFAAMTRPLDVEDIIKQSYNSVPLNDRFHPYVNGGSQRSQRSQSRRHNKDSPSKSTRHTRQNAQPHVYRSNTTETRYDVQ